MSRELNPCQIAERSLIKKYRKELWKPFIYAIQRYELIQPGDKIAVCISGGKDSMLMAKLLQELNKYTDRPFELIFLIMDPGYSDFHRRQIENNIKLLNIPAIIFQSDIFSVVSPDNPDNQENPDKPDNLENQENPENQDAKMIKSPCYLCARMRRGYLYDKARELGCNKIALGHHFNDVIETVLISMFYGAQLQAMPPKLHSTNFPGMELIRPLYCVHEENIIAWTRYNNLKFIQCACRFTEQQNNINKNNNINISKRQEIKLLLKRLKQTDPDIEKRIFNSIHQVALDTFPGYKSGGVLHSFLENY